jgi:5-methylcytosine-specific restriction endonuclease McrA
MGALPMSRKEFNRYTKLLAFYRAEGKCQKCGIKLAAGNIQFHHDKECTFGGLPELDNCVVLCVNCHSKITGKRAAVIAKSNRQRAKHIGIKKARPSFATNRSGPFKKKIDGTVERR